MDVELHMTRTWDTVVIYYDDQAVTPKVIKKYPNGDPLDAWATIGIKFLRKEEASQDI